jgi:hypothetical protein
VINVAALTGANAAQAYVVAIVSVQVKAITVVGGSTLSVSGLLEGVIADPLGIVEMGNVPAP